MKFGKIYPDTTHFASGHSLVCCLHEYFITKCDNIWHSSRWAWHCHGYSSLISVAARMREATLRSACHQPSYIGISEIKMRNNNFMKWRLCLSPKPRVQVKSQAFWGQVWSQVLILCLCDLSATGVESCDSSPHLYTDGHLDMWSGEVGSPTTDPPIGRQLHFLSKSVTVTKFFQRKFFPTMQCKRKPILNISSLFGNWSTMSPL